MICKKCGARQSSVAVFCGVCGTRISGGDALDDTLNMSGSAETVGVNGLTESFAIKGESLSVEPTEKLKGESDDIVKAQPVGDEPIELSSSNVVDDAVRVQTTLEEHACTLSCGEKPSPPQYESVKKTDAHLSVGQYLSSLIVMLLPVVGFVFALVHASINKNEDRRNFARAIILYKAIFWVFALIAALIVLLYVKVYLIANGHRPF